MSSKKMLKRNRRLARQQEKRKVISNQSQQVNLPIDKLWASIGKLHLQVESQAEALGGANREIGRLSAENAALKNESENLVLKTEHAFLRRMLDVKASPVTVLADMQELFNERDRKLNPPKPANGEASAASA